VNELKEFGDQGVVHVMLGDNEIERLGGCGADVDGLLQGGRLDSCVPDGLEREAKRAASGKLIVKNKNIHAGGECRMNHDGVVIVTPYSGEK
jgi:hypothetical protein